MIKLYPHQETGVEFLLRTPYAILADSMGLGKTIQAIELINRDPGKTLVICPAFLIHNWRQEIEKFAKDPSLFTLTSYAKVKHFIGQEFDVVLSDESHYLKNPDAKRTQNFYDLVTNNKPKRLVLMSGTPVKNRVTDFWSLLYLVGATDLEYYPFCYRFANVEKFRFGGRNITKFTGHKNVDELKRILAPVYLRRRASEVLDLPPIIRKDIDLAPERVDNELLQAWNEGKAFATVKKNSAKIKVKQTTAYAAELIAEGEGPLVIFSDHVEPVEDISGGLNNKGHKARLITGATPMSERDEVVQLFQQGRLDAIVATIGALSVGVTLTAARNMIFNDLPWVPADLLQAEKRIHRIGQNESCVIHRIFYGKVDTLIGRTLNKKLKTLIEVM